MTYQDAFHRLGFTLLRFSFSFIFLWFGLLKLFNVSPLSDLIFLAYPFIAQSHVLSLLLAVLEIAIGIGIFIPRISSAVLWIMIAHLLMATAGVFHSPYAFNMGFPILSFMGEFVVKNLALISGALVLISHDAPLLKFNSEAKK
ncbi:MAG: hypothetical protein Q7R94_03205 [bacterium]|nr:hypothetical protein [bacterium]